jgi:hypothetical protein
LTIVILTVSPPARHRQHVSNPARRLWHLFEPVHAVTYFAPASRAATEARGIKGFWSGYVVLRAAPLGAVPAAVVTAAFFGFNPTRAERALPSVITPGEALALRAAAAAEALRALGIGDAEELADLLWVAARSCDTAGRVLGAANQVLPRPDDPVEALWQATTTLREHRGDGHIAALVAHGIGPVEALQLKAATGEVPAEPLRLGRAWSSDEWAAGLHALTERGLMADGLLTPPGTALRQAVEDATDAAAGGPWQWIDVERVDELLLPLATAVVQSGMVPMPNPVGVSWPPPA